MQANVTAAELVRLDIPGKLIELVRGRLVVSEPPGTRHGAIAMNLAFYLMEFARRHDAGRVFAQDTGFRIATNPDTVRAPDVAFVRKARSENLPGRGYAALVPDLVAEVLSPDDRPEEVREKIADWLAAGVTLAWVIDPDRREASAHRAGSVSFIREHDVLDGEDVLPAFSLPLARILI